MLYFKILSLSPRGKLVLHWHKIAAFPFLVLPLLIDDKYYITAVDSVPVSSDNKCLVFVLMSDCLAIGLCPCIPSLFGGYCCSVFAYMFSALLTKELSFVVL